MQKKYCFKKNQWSGWVEKRVMHGTGGALDEVKQDVLMWKDRLVWLTTETGKHSHCFVGKTCQRQYLLCLHQDVLAVP